ncbi:hypothetical protein Tco_0075578 [Tanacetum coccineum]
MHVKFNKNTPNISGSGPKLVFDIDALTKSMNYESVVAGSQSNGSAGNKDSEVLSTEEPRFNQEKDANVNSTNNVNVAGIEDNTVDENIVYGCADDPDMPKLEEIGRFSDAE